MGRYNDRDNGNNEDNHNSDKKNMNTIDTRENNRAVTRINKYMYIYSFFPVFKGIPLDLGFFSTFKGYTL